MHTPRRRDLPTTIEADATGLAQRIAAMCAEADGRILLGICGAPGAGKSFVAAELARILGPDAAAVVPMDGFHLATEIIRGTPLAEKRGAIDTFDCGSYLSLLRRLRARDEEVVYAAAFRRGLEEPIAASISIPRAVPVIITEGNYLLAEAATWRAIRGELDAVWYLDVPDAVRVPRLIGRHVEFGRDEADATAFARGSDQANAALIAATRQDADLIVRFVD